MIATLARKSLRARWGRNLFMFLVIGFVVSFVAGTFILTDSIGSSVDDLISEGVDASSPGLIVRAKVTIDSSSAQRDPVPASEVAPLESLPGVDYVQGEVVREVVVVTPDDFKLGTGNGPPALAFSYPQDLGEGNTLDGAVPTAADEVVIDAATAKAQQLQLDDRLTIAGDAGTFEARIVGFVSQESEFSGVSPTYLFVAADLAPTLLGSEGEFDSLTVGIEPGADLADVQQSVETTLPQNLEVLTGDELTEEIQQQLSDDFNSFLGFFQTGLLIFAAISGFVGAFIINNLFGISIGQRLRELALLRAVGASRRQILRLVLSEAGLLSLISTLSGIVGGVIVAWLMLRLLDAVLGDLPSIGTVISARTIIAAFVVGVGVVLVSAIVPAVRAARIPPVAAMRPEVGYQALSASRRLIGGVVVTAVGIAAFLYGLFGSVDGGRTIALLIGGGALVLVLGVTSLSTTVANPVSRALGYPIARLFGTPGAIARDNAARSPRRTARTAAALMIGVAIISTAAMFASSLKASFNSILDRSVVSDFAVVGVNGTWYPDTALESLDGVPDVAVVSSERRVLVEVTTPKTDEQLEIVAIDPATYDEVLKLLPIEGSYEAMAQQGGIGVWKDAAKDAGVRLGDRVTVGFANGETLDIPVSMIFDDGSLGDHWFVPYDVVESVTSADVPVSVTWINTVEGVNPSAARATLEGALADAPQVEVQSNADFKNQISTGINIMQTTVTILLSGAVLLSFVSIAVTLALSVIERTREIGLLRAVGMTRRQLRRTIRWEAVIVTVFGVVVGLVMGLLIGYALLEAIPANFISVIALPYFTIIFVVILAVIAALVAALYPAVKASRMDVLRAISAE